MIVRAAYHENIFFFLCAVVQAYRLGLLEDKSIPERSFLEKHAAEAVHTPCPMFSVTLS